jgi:UDP-N-acetyl-2-amino-2-deoxyglucuronate dehydrogenase
MKKFALVGCGDVAVHHAENILRIGELTAVCDIVPERADTFASTYGAKAYNTIDDLLDGEKEMEIVVICTPNGFHAEHIIKSLQAQKHVLCESPLCLTTAAAWQIIETEKFCRRRLFVVNPAFHHPLLQKLKTLLENERIGEVYSFQLHGLLHVADDFLSGWRGKAFPGGGLLYTIFSQYIDAMALLFGEIADVRGFKRNAAPPKKMEAEDTGTIALQMQNGILGTFHWSVNAQKRTGTTLTIVAEKGTICLESEELTELKYAEPESLSLALQTGEALFDHNMTGDLKAFYDELTPALENNVTAAAGVFHGLKTVEAIEKIYKALS